MPKDDAEDLFKTPKKMDTTNPPTPGSKLPVDDFGTEEKKDDLFGPGGSKTDAFKITPDGILYFLSSKKVIGVFIIL